MHWFSSTAHFISSYRDKGYAITNYARQKVAVVLYLVLTCSFRRYSLSNSCENKISPNYTLNMEIKERNNLSWSNPTLTNSYADFDIHTLVAKLNRL